MCDESIRPSLKMGGKSGNKSTFCMSPSRVFFRFFNELGLLRRHIQREHLNKWSPWHKYIRANTMNIEIPEEMGLFAELKTLTENVRERCFRVIWRAADWRRTIQWNEEASQEQRSLVKRRAKKAATNWRRRSGGRRCNGPDNPGAPEALTQLEAQVRDLKSSTHLHSVPTKRGRHRERATWWKSSQTW